MAQTQTRKPARKPASETLPPLCNGDRLSRAEFERRWELHPDIKKAELINGQVYLEVTVGPQHAAAHTRLVTFLGVYAAGNPDCLVFDNVTVRMPGEDDVQPDAALLDRTGGQAELTEDSVLGVPQMVAEVAASSASYDLHLKRDLYERAGVQEYLVWQIYEERIDWWQLVDGKYEPMDLKDGTFESKVFPGLKLNAIAMLEGDMAAVLREVAPSPAPSE